MLGFSCSRMRNQHLTVFFTVGHFFFAFSTIHGFFFIIVVVETHNITNRLFWESGAKKGRGFRLFFSRVLISFVNNQTWIACDLVIRRQCDIPSSIGRWVVKRINFKTDC